MARRKWTMFPRPGLLDCNLLAGLGTHNQKTTFTLDLLTFSLNFYNSLMGDFIFFYSEELKIKPIQQVSGIQGHS